MLLQKCAEIRRTPQAVGDDISYIQSQGRGLQVQTQNQRALLGELENLVVRLTSLSHLLWID